MKFDISILLDIKSIEREDEVKDESRAIY